MARLDGLFFGYRIFTVEKTDVKVLAAALLSLGINARISAFGSAQIRLSDAPRMRAFLGGRVAFSESEIKGLPGFLYRNRKRWGTFAALLFSVFTLVWTSGAVWDVRVEGTEETAKTEALLCELGLYPGARFSELDKSAIEARMLAESDKISWVNINRRGTVAYVRVREGDVFDTDEGECAYSNVVAECDAVIEDVSVKSGYALVKPGDAVRAGDILISGIIPGELGGGFCRAEGVVIGRVGERYSVLAERFFEEKVPTEQKLTDFSYKILNFGVNILKNSGNLDKKCDIIENNTDFTLFGKRLPVSSLRRYAVTYKTVRRERTASEMTAYAARMLTELLSRELSDAELLKIKTGGEFSAEGYVMYSEVTLTRDIARRADVFG